ncbi:hypothetical protein [Thalassoroseus pseudoceratinae]|uniref:hypothetical protein n=1 Tax=Thalassoroseus pseudoceratinae TaxID=2713176 RepID=UPI0036F336C9
MRTHTDGQLCRSFRTRFDASVLIDGRNCGIVDLVFGRVCSVNVATVRERLCHQDLQRRFRAVQFNFGRRNLERTGTELLGKRHSRQRSDQNET